MQTNGDTLLFPAKQVHHKRFHCILCNVVQHSGKSQVSQTWEHYKSRDEVDVLKLEGWQTCAPKHQPWIRSPCSSRYGPAGRLWQPNFLAALMSQLMARRAVMYVRTCESCFLCHCPHEVTWCGRSKFVLRTWVLELFNFLEDKRVFHCLLSAASGARCTAVWCVFILVITYTASPCASKNETQTGSQCAPCIDTLIKRLIHKWLSLFVHWFTLEEQCALFLRKKQHRHPPSPWRRWCPTMQYNYPTWSKRAHRWWPVGWYCPVT